MPDHGASAAAAFRRGRGAAAAAPLRRRGARREGPCRPVRRPPLPRAGARLRAALRRPRRRLPESVRARADRARLATRRVPRRRPRVHHLCDPRRQLRGTDRPLHRRPVPGRGGCSRSRPSSATATSGGNRRATRSRRFPTDLALVGAPSRRAMLVRRPPWRGARTRPRPSPAMAQALQTRPFDELVFAVPIGTPFRNPGGLLPMKRRFALKAAWAALAVSGLVSFPALAADTIKVGILHSLSGTMAISETVLKDVALMTIDEINAKGGVLGKKLEPVVVDPASNWPLFAEKAKQLISQDKVAVVFGCWTQRVAQVGAAGVRGSQRAALLSGPVRRRGAVEERLLHGRGAEPAGDPGGGVPDEQGRRLGQALRAARHRLRLSAHDQQDPALLPEARASRTRTSWRSTRRSATPTTRPSSARSRSSLPKARRRRSSRRSTATRTCRSTRSSATRA